MNKNGSVNKDKDQGLVIYVLFKVISKLLEKGTYSYFTSSWGYHGIHQSRTLGLFGQMLGQYFCCDNK